MAFRLALSASSCISTKDDESHGRARGDALPTFVIAFDAIGEQIVGVRRRRSIHGEIMRLEERAPKVGFAHVAGRHILLVLLLDYSRE